LFQQAHASEAASSTGICRLKLTVSEDIASNHREEVMSSQVPKYVTQKRVSLLLGIPEAELSRMSQESGFGQVERAGRQEETYFTYEELPWICMLAAYRMQAIR